MPATPTAKLTSKGQITLPKAIRDRLKLRTGDQLKFVTDQNGRVILEPPHWDFESIRGIFKSRRKKPMSIEEMNEIIAAGWAGE